jgi:hypothetical protein
VNTWATWRRRRWRAEEPSGVLADRAAGGDVAAEVAARVAVEQVLDRLRGDPHLADLTERRGP